VPLYARGHIGHVERLLPEFVIPEDEAWGRLQGRRSPLYRVVLHQAEVWPGYRGPATDTVELEIFEHWLEPVTASTP
jgi:nitrile hydratase